MLARVGNTVVSNSGVCLQYKYEKTAPLDFMQPRCKWGRILLILWTQGMTKPSAIPWVNLLLKVQHADRDNSEYALCSGKQPTFI